MDASESVSRRKRRVAAAAVAAAAIVAVLVQPGAVASTSKVREGGIFRVAFQRLDYIDPALASAVEARALFDTTCARLMTYPDKPPPEGFRLVPEVAAAYPRVSHDGKTWTFRLRSGFRFSNGAPVRAERVRACDQPDALPQITSPALPYTQAIVGADGRPCGTSEGGARRGRPRQHAGRALHAASTRLPGLDDDVVLLRRPAGVSTSTRKASTSSPPPGRTTWPSTGRRSGSSIRQNRYYGGSRARTTWTASTSTFARERPAGPRPRRTRRGRLGLHHRRRSTSILARNLSGQVRRATGRSSSSGPDSRCECSCSTPRARCLATTRAFDAP